MHGFSPLLKTSSYITHSCSCREAGNEDASMAELSDSSESDDEEDGEENVTTNGLGDAIAKAWSLRAQKLHHDYSITAWALSVYPEVYEDAKISITGEHREAIERVVRKLFKYPYANHITSVKGMSEDEIVDTFWDEFKMFRNKSGVYDKASRWNSQTATKGKSHLWHEKYSRDYTKVLGVVACLSCSPNPGIGPCERNWGGVKGIKFGNRTLMGADSIKKRSIVYTTAVVSAAREKRDANERIDVTGSSAMFCDDDDK